MKKSLILAVLLLAGINAMADKVSFIGTNYSNSKTTSTEISERDTYMAIKLGMLDGANRYYIQYSKDSGYTSITYNHDYLFYSYSLITPYIGVHIGGAEWKLDKNNKDTGSEYGVQCGIIVDLSMNLTCEIGARYTKANAGFVHHPTNITRQYDNIKSTYIGLNYKF